MIFLGEGKVDKGNDSSIQSLYMREIGKIPLLSEEEEKDLFKRLVDGDLSVKKRIVEANLRLVVSIIAKVFCGEYRMGFLDLVQEGNMGLLRAVEKFDPTLGWRFSTYATLWIRQHVFRAVANKARSIRVPVHMHEQIIKCIKLEREYTLETGKTFSSKDIAERLGVPLEKADLIRESSGAILSLETPASDETESSLGDLLPDKNFPDPEELAFSSVLAEEVREVLETLSPREREVLARHYGLMGHEEETLGDIGAFFGISKERVRQIKDAALSKIKHRPDTETRFQDFLPKIRKSG